MGSEAILYPSLTLLRQTPIAPNCSRVPRVSAERRPSVTKVFPKFTARLVFKIKSSFFSPFLVNGYILSCKCQKCKKIILSYIYVELCYSENEIFHIFTYITAAVRQTAKDTVFNYFLLYSTQKLQTFSCIRLYETITPNYRKFYYKPTNELLKIYFVSARKSVFQIFAKIPFSHINTSGLLEDVGK